ncbi:hypothetical protein V6N11_033417 [Hibiscus sabdariffa]|uniref:Uncharacterized protein n=1 Tax=Hibiscus sabdariffa TaxID=183260 RepID=A0ABR2PYK7_9ROSI
MSVMLGSVPTIVVSSPAATELFLKTHDAVFAGRPKLQTSEYLTLHLVSASKVESFAPVRKEELAWMVESVRKAETAGETVDLSWKVSKVIEVIIFSDGPWMIKSNSNP